jgi:hypothetical protein
VRARGLKVTAGKAGGGSGWVAVWQCGSGSGRVAVAVAVAGWQWQWQGGSGWNGKWMEWQVNGNELESVQVAIGESSGRVAVAVAVAGWQWQWQGGSGCGSGINGSGRVES